MNQYYYVYVLRSQKDKNLYTDYTSNLLSRLNQHNRGMVQSTAKRTPMDLIYWEGCLNQQDATRREKYLKTAWGKRYLKSRLKNYLTGWICHTFPGTRLRYQNSSGTPRTQRCSHQMIYPVRYEDALYYHWKGGEIATILLHVCSTIPEGSKLLRWFHKRHPFQAGTTQQGKGYFDNAPNPIESDILGRMPQSRRCYKARKISENGLGQKIYQK